MSAIGDYIYYTKSGYVTGDPRTKTTLETMDIDYPDRNYIKLSQAMGIFKHTREQIRQAFTGLGDDVFAAQYSKLLNLYTGEKSIGQNDGRVKEHIRKKLADTFGTALKEVSLDKLKLTYGGVKGTTGSSDGGLIDILDIKSTLKEQIKNLKINSNTKKDFITRLKALEEVLTDPNAAQQIQSSMMNKNPKQVIQTRLNYIRMIIQGLDKGFDSLTQTNGNITIKGGKNNEDDIVVTTVKKAKNAFNRLNLLFNNENAMIEGFHSSHTGTMIVDNKKITGSTILQEIKSILNVLTIPNSALLGSVTEHTAAFTAACAQRIGGYYIAKEANAARVRGQESSYAAVKVSDIKVNDEIEAEMKKHYSDKIVIGDDGEEYYISSNLTQNKIDVSLKLQDENGDNKGVANISVKHSGASNMITFLSNGSLWNMIANENQNDFVNHYINLMAPKHIENRKKKVFDKHFNAAKAMAETTMNMLAYAKALAGYNLTRVTEVNGSLKPGSMEMPNYLTVYSTSKGEWYTWPMEQIYNNFIDRDSKNAVGYKQGFIIVTSDGAHTVNPFKDFNLSGFKNIDSDLNSVINKRIVATLNAVHRQKITVYTTVPKLLNMKK